MTARHLREEYADETAAALGQSSALNSIRSHLAEKEAGPTVELEIVPTHSPSVRDPRRCRVCGRLWAFCLHKWQPVKEPGGGVKPT